MSKRNRRNRETQNHFLLKDKRREAADWQAVVIDLRRFTFVHVVKLLRGAQNFTGTHLDLSALFIEERVFCVFPRVVQDWIYAAAALRQPKVP